MEYVSRLVMEVDGRLLGYEFLGATDLGASNRARNHAEGCSGTFKYVQTVRVKDRIVLDLDGDVTVVI